ncbi:MAG: PIG-L deacetylase family protein [Anaerolineales bacterium]
MSTLKLMAVFPHPDDETLGLGSTLAKYAAEGVETYLLCATRGERGWAGDPKDDPGLTGLGQIRAAELQAAARVLGLHEVTLLDYIDGDVDQADPARLIAEIVQHVRRVQPQVVVTFPPDGNYGHPDHIALSQFTTAALVCAADASYTDSAQQPAHRVSKLYYMVDAKSMVELLQKEFGFDIRMAVDGVERNWVAWEPWAVTTRLDTAEHWHTVVAAMRCHQSQLPSLGDMPNWPEEIQRKVWAHGTFYRAYSLVNGGRRVETDLFEGLR